MNFPLKACFLCGVAVELTRIYCHFHRHVEVLWLKNWSQRHKRCNTNHPKKTNKQKKHKWCILSWKGRWKQALYLLLRSGLYKSSHFSIITSPALNVVRAFILTIIPILLHLWSSPAQGKVGQSSVSITGVWQDSFIFLPSYGPWFAICNEGH